MIPQPPAPSFAPVSSPVPARDEQKIHSGAVSSMTSHGLDELKRLINEAALQRITLSETLHTDEVAFARAGRKLALARAFIIRLFTQRIIPRLAAQVHDTGEQLEDTRAHLDACHIDIDFGFDAAAAGTFAAMCRSFDTMRASQRIWDITATVETDRVRERTTATQSISRTPVEFNFSQVDILRSKYQTMRFGNVSGLEIHLYPGFVLTREPGADFALIEWKDAAVEFKISRFIEEDAVPKDSEVIGNTWAKANKDGSPDRRFNNNYQIPIVKYGELWFGSPTGLLEAYMVSNCGSAENFSIAVAHHKDALDKLADNPPPAATEEVHDSAEEETTPPLVEVSEPSTSLPRFYLDWIALAVLVIAIGYSGFWLNAHIPALLSALRHTADIESVATKSVAPTPVPPIVSKNIVYVHSGIVNIRSAPGMSGRIVGKATRGTKLNVFGVTGRWTEVGEDKPVGWVLSILLKPTAS